MKVSIVEVRKAKYKNPMSKIWFLNKCFSNKCNQTIHVCLKACKSGQRNVPTLCSMCTSPFGVVVPPWIHEIELMFKCKNAFNIFCWTHN